MFPQRLDSQLAYDIAKAMLDGFNRHYRLFRLESQRAKHRFETADWHGQQRAQRERIEFYDLRVREAVVRLEKEFKAGEQPMDVWHQVKLHYIGLLVDQAPVPAGLLDPGIANAICPDVDLVTLSLRTTIREVGLECYVWTVNEPALMDRLVNWEVDGIITDYPNRLRAVMEQRQMPLPPPVAAR